MIQSAKKEFSALLVTYAFPATSAPESYLCTKLLGDIKAINIDVISLDTEILGMKQDKDYADYIKEKFGSIDLVRPHKLQRLLFPFLKVLSFISDRFLIFNRDICKLALDKDLSKYDILITWSQWHSAHLAGLRLKTACPEIFWVAHFSDPWGNNPFLPLSLRIFNFGKFLEKLVWCKADLIQFPSHEMAVYCQKKNLQKYASKTSVVPHVFDEKIYPERTAEFRDKKLIRHLGHFYGPRSVKPFLDALIKINRANPDFFNSFEIEFFGRIGLSKAEGEIYSKTLPANVQIFEETVPYQESLRLISEADAILVIDATIDFSIFFPSKLVDAIGGKACIIAVTPNGVAREIVRGYGGFVVGYLDGVVDVDALQLSLSRVSEGYVAHGNLSYRARFCSNLVANKFDDVIRSLMNCH